VVVPLALGLQQAAGERGHTEAAAAAGRRHAPPSARPKDGQQALPILMVGQDWLAVLVRVALGGGEGAVKGGQAVQMEATATPLAQAPLLRHCQRGQR